MEALHVSERGPPSLGVDEGARVGPVNQRPHRSPKTELIVAEREQHHAGGARCRPEERRDVGRQHPPLLVVADHRSDERSAVDRRLCRALREAEPPRDLLPRRGTRPEREATHACIEPPPHGGGRRAGAIGERVDEAAGVEPSDRAPLDHACHEQRRSRERQR